MQMIRLSELLQEDETKRRSTQAAFQFLSDEIKKLQQMGWEPVRGQYNETSIKQDFDYPTFVTELQKLNIKPIESQATEDSLLISFAPNGNEQAVDSNALAERIMAVQKDIAPLMGTRSLPKNTAGWAKYLRNKLDPAGVWSNISDEQIIRLVVNLPKPKDHATVWKALRDIERKNLKMVRGIMKIVRRLKKPTEIK